jgi:hypothetical protein
VRLSLYETCEDCGRRQLTLFGYTVEIALILAAVIWLWWPR